MIWAVVTPVVARPRILATKPRLRQQTVTRISHVKRNAEACQ
jgi:hypothetical protein